MSTTKYRALAYQGVAWLKDLGLFDTFDEAVDALTARGEKYYGTDSDEDYEINYEVYWFDSNIREEQV